MSHMHTHAHTHMHTHAHTHMHTHTYTHTHTHTCTHAHTHTCTHAHIHNIADFCLLYMLHFHWSGCVDGALLFHLQLECCAYQVCLQRWQPGGCTSLLTSGHTVHREHLITTYFTGCRELLIGLLVIDFIAVQKWFVWRIFNLQCNRTLFHVYIAFFFGDFLTPTSLFSCSIFTSLRGEPGL